MKKILNDFYKDLLDSQVEPDPECMRILWENIWDLYSYSDEKK